MTAWHVAPSCVRHLIERDGLRGEPLDEDDPGFNGGVWAWTDRARATVTPGTAFDVWEIADDVPMVHGSNGSTEWYEDDPVVVTFYPIPASKVRRVSV